MFSSDKENMMKTKNSSIIVTFYLMLLLKNSISKSLSLVFQVGVPLCSVIILFLEKLKADVVNYDNMHIRYCHFFS